jgi:hypothetical protein
VDGRGLKEANRKISPRAYFGRTWGRVERRNNLKSIAPDSFSCFEPKKCGTRSTQSHRRGKRAVFRRGKAE